MANPIFKLKKSSVAGRIPDSADLAYGELAINYHDGKLYYKNDSNGVSTFSDDLSFDHYTADTFDSDLGTKTTGDLNEGSNLYYTTTRFDSDLDSKTADAVSNGTYNMYYSTSLFDSDLALKTTADLAEGTDLYYTTARADSDAKNAISVTDAGGDGSLTYNSGTGVIAYTGPSAAEVRSHFAVTGDLTYDSATGVFSFASGAYTSSTFDSDLSINTTDNLAEGSTNLYYTTARADSDIGQDVATTANPTFNNITSTGTISVDRANAGYASLEMGGSSGALIDLKAPFSDDYDARIIYRTGVDLQIHTLADEPILLRHGGSTKLATTSTGASITGNIAVTGTVDGRDVAGDGTKLDNIEALATADQTPAQILAAIETVDGAGSGLDADLLDGQQGAYYLNYTNFTSTPNVLDSADVRNIFSVSGDLTYNSGTGQFSVTTYKTANFDSDFGLKTTDGLTEGSNLYYTAARFNTAFSGKSTADLSEGSNLYYTTARADSDAKHSVSGGTGVSYTPSTGVITIGQPVGTTDDVVFGKIAADSANVSTIDFVSQATAPANRAGALYWDSDPQQGLSFIPITNEGLTDVTINIGQELLIYAHNQTGETISNGAVVQVVGTAHGLHPLIAKAQSNVAINGHIAVATQEIVDNAHGYITRVGVVNDVNTGGMVAGANLYVSADSAGVWTPTEVSIDTGYPYHVGKVLRVDSSTGSILVDPFSEHVEYLRVEDRLKVDGPIEGTSYMGTYFDFDGTAPTHQEGRVWYDSANGALAVYNQVADITMQVGQEQWVKSYNNSGSAILNGKVVYISASHGGTPAIDLASAAGEASAYSLGIATHDIPNGTYGYVTQSGIVNDVDTSAFSPGDRLHVSTTPGELQVAVPPYPAFANEVGVVLLSDSAGGKILVDHQAHTFESIRSTGDGRIDGNLTVGGNLSVVGITTEARTQSITVSSNLVKLLDGDTLGTLYQNYSVPAGLDDATFRGNYTGDSAEQLFIRMVSLDSTGDVIEFGISDSDTIPTGSYGVPFDSAGGPTTWNLLSDGLTAPLKSSVSIEFLNATGHADSDLWCAHATELNLDLGVIGNYNPAGSGGLKYTGVYRDAADGRWKFFDNSTQPFTGPDATQFEVQDSAGVGYALAPVQASTFYGALSGNATSASIATILQSTRTFSLSGEVTTTSPQSFNGSTNVVLPVTVASNVIDNDNIKAAAGIVDSKLATISTAGKVQNGATTATSANTGSAIVARDASGNFSAGTITATVAFVGDGSSLTGLPAGYTITNFDSDFGTKTTDNLTEGTNKYFATGLVDAHLSGSTGITYSAGAISITNSGVSANTYGDAANIPQLTVNAQGQITGVSNIAVDIPAGYTQTNFDSDVTAQSAELLTSIKTVDGAGSGLDADLLDGQQGAYYRINIYDNTGSLLN